MALWCAPKFHGTMIMTNNFEDENHDEFAEHDHENGGQDGERKASGVTGNLVEAWRTKPMFKFMVLLAAVFAVVVAAVNFLGGSDTEKDLVHLSRAPNFKEAPGGKTS